MHAPLYAQQFRSLVWRRRILALGAFGATVAAVVVVTAATLGGGTSGAAGISLDGLRGHPVTVGGAGHLSRPVQQAAGAPGAAAGTMLVVGGVDDGGSGLSAIQRVEGTSSKIGGRLPSSLVGAGAVGIRGAVYVFGVGRSGAGGGGTLGVG
ncbi:MAG: hypothetical protein LC720_05550, partial [Actinobacteria bacterium]|nr:hypothetical protein [Actinomycetota bacterium]